MTWFKASSPIKTVNRVDRQNGIIFGVAVNSAVEAKGHKVFLEEEFVQEVTRQGELAKGLKSRLGHPTMSGSAIGSYLGRLHNFRTELNDAGIAVSKADLHLSKSAKSAPQGDLYSYVLDMAENDPDQFGMSIAFKNGKRYRRNAQEQKVFEDEQQFDQLKGKTFATLASLHAADVVDTPAATDGLFSEFTNDLSAAKVTQFLEENPDVEHILFGERSIIDAFIERQKAYRNEEKKESEMSELSKEEVGFFKAFMSGIMSAFGKGPVIQEGDEVPVPKVEHAVTEGEEAPAPKKIDIVEEVAEVEEAEIPDEPVVSEEVPELEEAETEDEPEDADSEDSELSTANSRIIELEILLATREEQLSELSAGFTKHTKAVKPVKKKFNSWNEALKATESQFENYEDAFDYCVENYGDLYPKCTH